MTSIYNKKRNLFPFLKERVICEKFALKETIMFVCMSVPNQSDFRYRKLAAIDHWWSKHSWTLGNWGRWVRIWGQIWGQKSKEHRHSSTTILWHLTALTWYDHSISIMVRWNSSLDFQNFELNIFDQKLAFLKINDFS